ncbi:MAG TPA: acetyltransferase [Pyrinomonadaceae bacterium]|nr:acetyltransferase [Pyrinomonadaceae bacterium]
MTKTQLVLWGASDHATVVADVIRQQGVYDIIGYLDDVRPERAGEAFCGATVLGGREQLPLLRGRGISHVVMAFGDNQRRLNLGALVLNEGCELATAVHPAAIIAADVRIGHGTVVMAGVVINPGTVIGQHAIINTAAVIEHGCQIGDGALINSRSCIAGNVTVERAATVEIGAIVASGLRIGAAAVVGAGSLVLKDVPEATLVYGSPAKVIKKFEP